MAHRVGHEVSFEELLDYVEDRLHPVVAQRVSAHLAAGCAQCMQDVAWLRRVLAVMAADALVDAPRSTVARAQGLYRQRRRRIAWSLSNLWSWLRGMPGARVAAAVALAALLILSGTRAWGNTMVAQAATLAEVGGAVEVRLPGADEWQAATPGMALAAGSMLRSGPGAVATLVYPDGSRTYLSAGAELQILGLSGRRNGRAASIRLAGPVLLAALGEIFDELSGVLNIGIEGTILLGALTSFLVSLLSGNAWLGLLAAVLVGLLVNLPLTGMMDEHGLLRFFYDTGVLTEVFPCLIFVGIGAMTDFRPLLTRPSILLLGAAGQFGIFLTIILALALGMTQLDAVAVGVIGACDGPTAIYVTSQYAPHLLGPVSVAAYSYMSLVPLLQPPIMRALTTEKERKIVMKATKEKVSNTVCILFPIEIGRAHV